MKKRFVVVDLETTGNSPKKGDKIIQFAAVVIEDGEIIERFATFVNPKQDIPVFIEQFTGISNEVVANAPDFSIVAPEIISSFKDSYFVAHNVPFDYSFLQEELAQCGFENFHCPTIDTVELSRVMLPLADSYKLGQLAETLSLTHENPHQADSDAEVTAEILLKILLKIEQLPLVTVQKLYSLSTSFKSDIREILSEFLDEKSTHVDKETRFDIYRGLALHKKTKKKEKRKQKSNTYTETFHSVLHDFSFRQGQREMVQTIHHAMETNQHAMIEAGTGIGKSIAYLLPAIYISKMRGRCMISTNTLQLQHQLLEKDIAKIREILSFDFEVALLKGRGNYLSLRKFEQILYENTDNYDEILTKAQILVWLTETATGDIDEINLPSGGKLLWERVKSTIENPGFEDSIWASRSFYQKARKAAEKADIVITNHALLLQDIENHFEILPSYDFLILDEAHRFEALAKRQIGFHIHYLSIHSVLMRIGLLDTNDLLAKSSKLMERNGFETDSFMHVNQIIKEIRASVNDFFRMIRSHVLMKQREENEKNRIQYILDSVHESGAQWQEANEQLTKLSIYKKELINQVQYQRQLVIQNKNLLTQLQLGLFNDYILSIELLVEKCSIIESIVAANENQMTWIEIDPRGPVNSATLHAEPTEVSAFLADQFFTFKKSVIMTSATLTVDGSFSYMIEKLGLDDFQPITLSIPSPFDFERQAALMVPTDLPLVNSVSQDEFVDSISNHIVEIANKTNGRMLILFTSYEMLQKTYMNLKNRLQLEQFVLIAQSITGGSRAKLTKNFQAFDKAILLGTSSFWEGVDIPGEDLTALIIVRLPFAPPNDPIFTVRAKEIEGKGGDAFKDLSLPEAIIRFKQGIGRLIRSEQDKGVIFVFDRRIITTRYGKQFLTSVPKMQFFHKPLAELLGHVEDWL
ncbi:ATP-dependent DNA helicase DinG [Bacillus sp. REN16]|uniref:ATP-dependent DNA helicase DinG n=1 Tax=Bacillus sp. REN16 TaxID=2887296 RepID=UPI001E2B6472|nr:ATP-dependent DNA helicase DinG [Bacillus sp. REN16]MCC3358355.1 ATP-dependent DNA helicase DinG [Bacillus sp. REN16]